MHFWVNYGVHLDHNLGTFDYLYQGSKICHLKFDLNTILFQ